MSSSYDVAIVGKGMMGSAAAKYLARAGLKVVLIGPDEPSVRATHTGAFASHHDAARITRSIDEDDDWALMARRSIERYGAMEAESGIRFYTEAGCMIVAPERDEGTTGSIAQALGVRDRVGSTAEYLDAGSLSRMFPQLVFPDGYAALFERRGAGYIDPRALVRAQAQLAAAAGAEVLTTEASSIRDQVTHMKIANTDQSVVRCDKVLVATGGYAIGRHLLPRPLAMTVKARTALLVELTEADCARFAQMPSVIQSGEDGATSFYALPPVRYPDGKTYVKIGGDPVDFALETVDEMNAWFRKDGSGNVVEHLRRTIATLMPGLQGNSYGSLACVTTFTDHGYPYIDTAGAERLLVLAGGNGKAAKSSDEIGRLGAVMVCEGKLHAEGYRTTFETVYRR